MPLPVGLEQSAPGTSGPDTFSWSASAAARAFGVHIVVRATDAALLPELLARLPPGSRMSEAPRPGARVYSVATSASRTADGIRPFWRVYDDDHLEAEVDNEADALHIFEGLVRFDVARLSARWTFVHAGVVGWRGRAIVIPGASYSGKSSLVHALVRAGASYYSDEYAVLDRRGRVYPFAKPLSLRRDNGQVDRIDVREIGGTRAVERLAVGLVVATRYVAGAQWAPERTSAGGTVLALLEHTVRAQIAPARVLRTLAQVAEDAMTFAGTRGEADDIVDDLLRRVAVESGNGENA